MPQALSNSQKFDLRREITDHAKALGFDLVGFSPAKIEEKYLKGFEEWLAAGREGTMDYMRKIDQRRDMNLVLPGAKTVIVFGLNYYHEQPPLPRGHGRIARYAYGRDYHKVIGKKLKRMEAFIAKAYSKIQPARNTQPEIFLNQIPESSKPRSSALLKICARAQILPQKTAEESHFVPKVSDHATPPPLTKSYVDTGPILERAYAEQAGIGRIGKNGCVISKEFGSWIFLSEIITTIDLNFSTTHQSLAPDSPLDNTFPVGDFLGSPNLREVPAPANLQKVSPVTQPKSARADFLPRKTAQESHLAPTSLIIRHHTANSRQSSQPLVSPSSGQPQTPPSRWSSPSQKSFNVCGNCTRCITACPTGAIIAPGVIDSRLCISYLTIENRKKIPPKLAKIIKKTKRLYGCDICQEVCPHNHARQRISSCPSEARTKHDYKAKGSAQQNTLSQPRSESLIPDLLDGLLIPIAGDSISLKKIPTPNSAFLRTFAGSPLMRAKRRGLQRNAKVLLSRPKRLQILAKQRQ